MKFVTGTEMFRGFKYDSLKTVFTKGASFVGGQKFPLVEGIIKTDITQLDESARVFFYSKAN